MRESGNEFRPAKRGLNLEERFRWGWQRVWKWIPLAVLFCLACGGERHPPLVASKPTLMSADRQKTPTAIKVRVLLAEGFETLEIRNTRRAQELDIRVRNNRIELIRDGKVLVAGSGFRLEAAQSRALGFRGHTYGGIFEVFLNPLGQPVLVNELELEDYLSGVVPLELGPKTYPELEALKAQAIAARSFTLRALGRYADRGFDLFSDQRSQVYLGQDSKHPLSTRAVRETEGVVATYEHRPIVAMYSSTCGGKTEGFDAIFGGTSPQYLKGGVLCHDENSRYHSWQETISVAELNGTLFPYARVGRLRNLHIEKRSDNGRVVEMRFEGTEGQKVLKGNDLRFALGLKSNYIESMRLSKDAKGFIESVRFEGRGWGHGVGLCQHGAVKMADQAKDYAQILKHYYPGIELTRWYQ